jgi:hypothetical protein
MNSRVIVLVGLALLVGVPGCSKSEKDLLRERTKRFDEAADVLATVTDRESYEKAKPKLKAFMAYRRETSSKAREKVEKMSSEEKEAAKKERGRTQERTRIREMPRSYQALCLGIGASHDLARNWRTVHERDCRRVRGKRTRSPVPRRDRCRLSAFPLLAKLLPRASQFSWRNRARKPA